MLSSWYRFLWVFFQIEELCAQTNDKEILYVMETLPKDLPSTYQRSLSKIIRDGKSEVVKKMLLFAALVKRPLSRMELRDAIAVEPDQEDFEPGRLVNDVQRMVSWSHNLLLLDEEDDLVTYAHYTIKDFLSVQQQSTYENLGEFHIDRTSAEIFVGHVCCTYVQFRNFDNQVGLAVDDRTHRIAPRLIASTAVSQTNDSIIAKTWLTLDKLKYSQASPKSTDTWLHLQRQWESDQSAPTNKETHQFIFLDYASSYWLDHTAETTPDEKDAWRAFNRTFFASNRSTTGMQAFSSREWEELAPPVCRYISLHNHLGLIFTLTAADTIVTTKTESWRNNYLSLIPPVITTGPWIAFYILMKGCATRSAFPHNLDDRYFGYYLQALKANKTLIAIWILRISLKIFANNKFPFEELLVYSHNSNWKESSEIVQSKFEEAIKTTIHLFERYPLAASGVTSLLKNHRHDARYQRAITLAFSEGPIIVLRLLVLYEERVFDRHLYSFEGLLSAVRKNEVHVCRRLFQAGIDPQFRLLNQVNSVVLLQNAIKNVSLDALYYLLSCGTSPDNHSSWQWSPLCAAIAKEEPKIVSELLKYGADPNKIVIRLDDAAVRPDHSARPRGELTTPLLEAVIRGSTRNLRQIRTMLLEKGAYISAGDLLQIPVIASIASQYQEYSKYIAGSIEYIHIPDPVEDISGAVERTSLERQYEVFGKYTTEETGRVATEFDIMTRLERQYDEYGKYLLDYCELDLMRPVHVN